MQMLVMLLVKVHRLKMLAPLIFKNFSRPKGRKTASVKAFVAPALFLELVLLYQGFF